ncbi:MAG TPA: hypothetical protein VN317_00355 [Candidatus Methanoperedens sp.]|nr:hypothetical protein [Candidatus Methanoperedens sp.]
MKKRVLLCLALVIGVLCAAVPGAQAAILGSAANVNPIIHGCGLFVLDVNGSAAGTDLLFTLPASASARPFAVLFNGECSVASLDTVTYLDVNVQILNAAGGLLGTLSPSSSENAFCTSSGRNALDRWVSASTNGVASFAPGGATALRVRVVATLQNCVAPEQYRVDDLSTIVIY